MSLPTRSIALLSDVLSYPKNVPNSFICRRLKGIKALEGSGKVPAICTIVFSRSNLCPNFLELCAPDLLNGWMKNTKNSPYWGASLLEFGDCKSASPCHFDEPKTVARSFQRFSRKLLSDRGYWRAGVACVPASAHWPLSTPWMSLDD